MKLLARPPLLILLMLSATILLQIEARGQLNTAPADAETHPRLEKAVFGLG